MIDQAILDELWEFDDADLSESRFRVELEHGGPWDETERAELMTQLARAIGMLGRFDEAAAVLIDIASAEIIVGLRVLLESGRIMNSSGNTDAATALFRQAALIASAADQLFLQIDALHMLAIVDAGGAEHWTESAIRLAEVSPKSRTQRWLVSLHSNIGWRRLEGGAAASALASFTEASRWADLVGTEQQREWTKVAVDDCRKLLGGD